MRCETFKDFCFYTLLRIMNFGAFGIMDSIMSVNFVCVCWHYVLEHYAFLPLEHYGVLPPYCPRLEHYVSPAHYWCAQCLNHYGPCFCNYAALLYNDRHYTVLCIVV